MDESGFLPCGSVDWVGDVLEHQLAWNIVFECAVPSCPRVAECPELPGGLEW